MQRLAPTKYKSRTYSCKSMQLRVQRYAFAGARAKKVCGCEGTLSCLQRYALAGARAKKVFRCKATHLQVQGPKRCVGARVNFCGCKGEKKKKKKRHAGRSCVHSATQPGTRVQALYGSSRVNHKLDPTQPELVTQQPEVVDITR